MLIFDFEGEYIKNSASLFFSPALKGGKEKQCFIKLSMLE
jgi:hypothetical protein